MTRDDAIQYAKCVATKAIQEINNNEETRALMLSICNEDNEYYELAKKQLDIWAEWWFPNEQ